MPLPVIQRPLSWVRLLIGGVVLLLLVALLNPFVTIGPGQRGVVTTFGAVGKEVLGEGLHLKIPLVQRVIKLDVRVQKSQVESTAASRDLQDTHSISALNYHIQPEQANWLLQHIGENYEDRMIAPAMQEVLKAVTARYTALELITQREQVRMAIRQQLADRLRPYSIVVDDFSIVNFKFSPQFTEAIESKQTAEQLALKAQRDLERIKIEAEQKIESARAEAEALRLQKENVTAELVQLRQIEVQQKAIDKWDGRLPQVTGGGVPLIDVSQLARTAN